jgi:hypothetical protein
MSFPLRTTLAASALLALAALPAAAGDLALEVHAGTFQMAAGNSASALFGSGGGGTFGGAVRYRFWRGAFVSAGARTFSKDGERVFVASTSSPVQRLGFPLTVRTTPIFLTVGYRLRDGKRVVPYGAVGGSITSYKEESTAAGETFDATRSEAGFLGAAGVEVGRGTFRFGAEVGYSIVPDAIGVGGVSKVYGEKDLGGPHAVGKLIVAF